ncbi:hypothetical protein [Aliikangiella sp. IMCC44359]|uniref:hypothetical protein n=1 Tax=Aliikangiella sp. IMCC44359 TaxID=3459125 RepID=UPI00403A943C
MSNSLQENKVEKLQKKAALCLSKKVDIPSSPLWNMGMAAKFNSSKDFKKIQEASDYLACKARAKLNFSEDDKEFLKELYEAFWWGGQWKGYKEAAQLANHYVNGNGKNFMISSEVYEQSLIVQATMSAMKLFISELKSKKYNYSHIKCNNPMFRAKPYAKKLTKMNYLTEGKMKHDGVLEAAQNDTRLHRADGHFYLEAYTVNLKTGKNKTTWCVNSIYDFDPFEKKNYYSEIPLGKFTLLLYDGLSEYMTKLGIAKVFNYKAQWLEVW